MSKTPDQPQPDEQQSDDAPDDKKILDLAFLNKSREILSKQLAVAKGKFRAIPVIGRLSKRWLITWLIAGLALAVLAGTGMFIARDYLWGVQGQARAAVRAL